MGPVDQLPKVVVAADPVASRFLSATLEKWAYDVVTFRDGEGAWHAPRQAGPPVLAILDGMMPGLDGRELCQKIRAGPRLPSAYVILRTARDSREDLIEGLLARADDYIAEPFDASALKARLGVGVRVLRLQKAVAGRVNELENALTLIKQLQGLRPTCPYCKGFETTRTTGSGLKAMSADIQRPSSAMAFVPSASKES
jgi:DNA-binding response OmpR family regulator